MFLFLESHANAGHCKAHQVIMKAADGLTVSFCIKFQFSSAYSVVWLLCCAARACTHTHTLLHASCKWAGSACVSEGAPGGGVNRNGGPSRWCSVVKTRSRSKYMHNKLQAWRGDSILHCDVSRKHGQCIDIFLANGEMYRRNKCIHFPV